MQPKDKIAILGWLVVFILGIISGGDAGPRVIL